MSNPSAPPVGLADAPDDVPQVVLPRSRIIWYVGIVWLLYFLDFMARFGVNPLYPLIQKDLGLDDAQVGLLGSVVLFGMAVLVLPLSYLADRWSRSKLLALMALVWSACSILSGLARSFPTLLVGRFGLGVGEASFAPTATSLLTSWFKRSSWGKVLGFFNTAVSLGIFCGSVFAGWMAVHHGWRPALIALGAPGILLGLLALTIPDPKASMAAAASTSGTAPALADDTLTVGRAAAVVRGNTSLKLLVLFYGLLNMGAVAVISWMPMFYTREMGLPVSTAAALAGGVALLGVVGFPLGGYITDRLVQRDLRLRMVFPAAIALTIAVLFAVGFALKSIPVLFLAFFIYSMVNASLNAASQELVPARYRSVSMGVVIFGMQAVGMVGPWLTGVFSMQWGLTTALMLIQLAFVACGLGLLWTARHYREDCAAVGAAT